MKSKLKNVLAVVVGVVVGSIANMMVVMIGPEVIPTPDGVDVTNVESIKASMHLFEFRHFIFPWVAHCAGDPRGRVSGCPDRRKLQDGSGDGCSRAVPDRRNRQCHHDRGPGPVQCRGPWLALTSRWRGSVQDYPGDREEGPSSRT